MTTLLRLRDHGIVDAFAGAAPQFGTYDLSGLTPAGRLIQAYASHVADRTVSDISPVYGDLRGLPPVLVAVGSADILLEDNMERRPRAASGRGSRGLRGR